MYASGGFYPYEIDQSVRFNDNDSAYLEKTFSTSGNAKTFTISFWFKRCRDDTAEYLFAGGTTVNDRFHMDINASGTFQIEAKNSGSTVIKMEGGPRLRDLGAWYHFVLRVDTTQATASDRVRLYVNGELLTFNSNTYPAQNTNLNWNVNDQVRIGRAGWATSYFDGYFAEFINVDGQSLAPTSFGETKAGIWIPKDYTGSYGTNGFKLAFQDSGALGDDTSGNGHDFTSSGLASTDQMLDTPTNNFATFNPLDNNNTSLFSEGNLQVGSATGSHLQGTRSTFAVTQNFYYEACKLQSGTTNFHLGVATTTANISSTSNPGLYTKAQSSGSVGDIIMIAYSADANAMWSGKNGTWDNGASVAEIEAGTTTNATHTGIEAESIAALFLDQASSFSGSVVANFGQDGTFAGNKTAQGNTDDNGNGDFYYAPPSGFLALCAANLPDPAIDPAADVTPEDYFNTVIYTGASPSDKAVTGVGFQPDFVWIKARTQAYNHALYDAVRGATKELHSNTTDAEDTDTNGLKSFDSDGFTVGSDGEVGDPTGTRVSWNWKAGGTAVSNTDGSITSSVSASPDSGFSVVSYTGSASGITVGHGLSSAPEMIIWKARGTPNGSARHWIVWHKDLTSTDYIVYLSLTDGQTNVAAGSVLASSPTSSLFSLGTEPSVNWSGEDYIAYCFHSVDGMVKVGSYTADGSADGPFIYTGFRPAFVLWKRYDASGNSWIIKDTARTTYNPMGANLFPNDSINENSDSDIDFLSNGFKCVTSNAAFNGSGREFIYLAFAEQPFKYANAR